MARIYTRQALLDPSMLAQDAAYRKSLIDSAAQNRIRAAEAISQGLTAFGKGAGEAIGQGIGMATRYGDFQDILNKYGDDPEAKAAAWKYLYEGDTNPLQSYINQKNTAAQIKSSKQLEIDDMISEWEGYFDIENDTSLSEFDRNNAKTKRRMLEAKMKNRGISIPTDKVSTKKSSSLYEIPSKTNIPQGMDLLTYGVKNDVTEENIEPTKTKKTVNEIEEMIANEEDTETIRDFIYMLDSPSDRTNLITKVKALEQSKWKTDYEEGKRIEEENKANFEKEVTNIKGMKKGNDKVIAMESQNKRADELGYARPFSADDIKNAKPIVKTKEEWVKDNNTGLFKYYKDGKFIKYVENRGDK